MIWRKLFQAEGTARNKGPQMGTNLFVGKKAGERGSRLAIKGRVV